MSSEDQITVGEYLLRRLRELGVGAIHGVPGDFNLAFLDLIDNVNGLYWVGNANELNAAYAADGYARVHNNISALITTFGVGELSALNGVAGAYSEHVPLVHIVGQPSTSSQKSGALLHHTLGNGDFGSFEKMSTGISCAKVLLGVGDEGEAAGIDRVLRECYVQARPVYVGLPTDVAFKKISAKPLERKIDLSLPENDKETEDYVVKEILKLLHSAKNPIILSDACAIRHRVTGLLHTLLDRTNLPAFVAPMGKSSVNETHERFGGVYAGSVSLPQVKEVVEGADLVLSVGALKSDFNTGSFSYHTRQVNTIEFHSDHIKIGYAVFPNIGMTHVLERIIDEMDVEKIRATTTATEDVPKLSNSTPTTPQKEILHEWFWPKVGQFLREGDVVVTETGTANFGILDARFPDGVIHVSQVLWGSIGFSVPATLGAALAAKELDADKDPKSKRRVILFVGDGSLQLTVQEISTMIRHNLSPILFILNNEGYTIERYIHGETASYNDIAPWKFRQLLDVFGGSPDKSKNWLVKTPGEVESLLEDEEFLGGSGEGKIQVVEVVMPRMDAPRALKLQAELTAKYNSEQ